MLKIYAVCPQGLGSSMIAKINVQNYLDSIGITDYDVETAGVASIVGENFDFILTVRELKDSLPAGIDMNKVIFIDNFFKSEDISNKVHDKLLELGYLKNERE